MTSDRPRRRPQKGGSSGRPRAGAMLGIAALCALLAGCSPRNHTNPFDPENPDTGGRPDLLDAVAGNGNVALSWTPQAFTDISGLRLLRVADGDTGVLAGSIDPAAGSYVDATARNDSTYDYVLQFFFSGQAQPLTTMPATATPGRRVVWVLDQRNGGPVQVSPDGRDRLGGRGSAGPPSDLDLLPATGAAATADFYGRRVDGYSPDGLPFGGRPLESSALSVAYDPRDSTVWVGGYDPSTLYHLDRSLNTVLSADSGIGVPEDLALDPARGTLWIADSNGRLLVSGKGGELVAIGGFSFPFSIAVDAATGDCWLADRGEGKIYRLAAVSASPVFVLEGFPAPFQIVSDPAGGGAYLTDSASGRVHHLGADGTILSSWTDVRTPTGIAVDPADGSVWVTDGSRDELVRFAPDGKVMSRLAGFNSPFEVSVAVPPASP